MGVYSVNGDVCSLICLLDSLHNPATHMCSRDVIDRAIPVQEHALPAPPNFFRISEIKRHLTDGAKHAFRLVGVQMSDPRDGDEFWRL